MGICMMLKAVTNSQINDFYDDEPALLAFLQRCQDPRGMIFRMIGQAAEQDPRYSRVFQVFGKFDKTAMEAAQDNSPVADLDKGWHGLHWIFTGSAYEGKEPLCYLLHKGLVIGHRGDHQVRAFSSKQLAAFQDAVEPFDESELRRRYDGKAMAAAQLNLSIMWARSDDEGIETLKYTLENLKTFLREAKAQNLGMLIWTT
jgi:hypothetical protein